MDVLRESRDYSDHITSKTTTSTISSKADSRRSITSSVEYEKHCGLLTTRSPRSSRPSSPDFSTSQRRPFSSSSRPPKYIILAIWPNARSDHIQYYTEGYASLYPNSKLLLLHHSHDGRNTSNIVNLLSTLLEDCENLPYHDASDNDNDSDTHQETLIHLFGDAAATNLSTLLKAYRRRTNLRLGVKALVLDTVPILVSPTLHFLRTNPGSLFAFLFYAIYAIYAFISPIIFTLKLWYSESSSARVRQDLYDPKLISRDARKCYIFAGNDFMFAWDRARVTDGKSGVERVAYSVKRDSVDRGEKWTGDKERYWLGIENAWEGG